MYGKSNHHKGKSAQPSELRVLLEQMTERSSSLVLSESRRRFSSLRDLVAYENEYDMGSDIFYARFMRGEMGDDLPFIMWAGQYESYLEAKQEIAKR